MSLTTVIVVVSFLLFTAASVAMGASLTVSARGGGVVVEQCVPTIVEVEPEPPPEPEPTPEPSVEPSPTPEPSPTEVSPSESPTSNKEQ